MWTREEIRRQVAEAFKPDPPKPKPTPIEKAQDHWAKKSGEAYAEQAAASMEAFAQVVVTETTESRRSKALAKEVADWEEAGKDPRVRYQRELDRITQAKLDLEATLDDGYVDVAGFREPRRFLKTKGDPDYGL